MMVVLVVVLVVGVGGWCLVGKGWCGVKIFLMGYKIVSITKKGPLKLNFFISLVECETACDKISPFKWFQTLSEV